MCAVMMDGGGETSQPNEIYRPTDVLPAGTAEARANPDRQPCHPKIPDSVGMNKAHLAASTILRNGWPILHQRVIHSHEGLFTVALMRGPDETQF